MPELKLKRKAFRMVGLLFPSIYALGDLWREGLGGAAAAGLLALFLGVMFTLEFVRFRRPGVNRWLFDHFRDYTKEKERARASSTTHFLLSCLLAILIFDKGIAIASMLMLVAGDPVAEVIGTRWGRVPLLGKTLEGTLGGLAACLLITLPLTATSLGLHAIVLVTGALAASLAELLPLPVDDNFAIPLGAGAAMTLAQSAAGGDLRFSPALEALLRMAPG